MTLNEFMNNVNSWDNNNGSFTVELTLLDKTKSYLVVEKCSSDYDAKERAFLYLNELIDNKNKR